MKQSHESLCVLQGHCFKWDELRQISHTAMLMSLLWHKQVKIKYKQEILQWYGSPFIYSFKVMFCNVHKNRGSLEQNKNNWFHLWAWHSELECEGRLCDDSTVPPSSIEQHEKHKIIPLLQTGKILRFWITLHNSNSTYISYFILKSGWFKIFL